MQIQLNGQASQISSAMTLQMLLDSLQLPLNAGGFAVCINDEVIAMSQWNARLILEDDVVEIVQATQGG